MLSLAFRVTFIVCVVVGFLGWLSTKIKSVAKFASPVDVEAITGYIILPASLLVTSTSYWVVIMPLILGLIMLPARISYIKKNENK